MLMSALLIHLTGGRIETHFHVFGSLAILAFYRDWRVLDSGDDGRRRGSHAARPLLAAVRVRRARRERVAMGRTCGVGDLRGRVPGDGLRPRHARTARDRRAHGGARRGEPRQRASRDRTGRADCAAPPDAAAGRGRDAREERVRREHEPRTADAAQCDHAVQRAAAGRRGRRQADRRRRGPAARFRWRARTCSG